MYTVKEVANQLGISRQAVYKRINKESFKEHLIIVGDSKHISKQGFQLLKEGSIKNKEIIEELNLDTDKKFNELQTMDTRLIDTLNSVIISKDEDIKDLKEENKKLLNIMEQQNQLLHESQQLQQKALSNTEMLLVQKRYELLIRAQEIEDNKKKSFRERLRIFFKGK